MKRKEITAKNLRRLAEQAGLNKKSLSKLYFSEEGKLTPNTVYQHWTGFREISVRAQDKYIEIFKMFGLNVTYVDFYKEK